MRADQVPLQRLQLWESRFEAMGCTCKVAILGADHGLLAWAETRVRTLESSWTRFRPDSELSWLNARRGRWNQVSPELLVLLRRGLAGYRISGGLFDPFMESEIVKAGYDRDLTRLDLVDAQETATPAVTKQGRRQVRHPLLLDVKHGRARLDSSVRFDSGGIGKGLAADLVATEALANGAAGALVSLGGDLRVAGAWPDDGWRVAVRDPGEGGGAQVKLRDGAICTSGTSRRRWRNTNGSIGHHIIDPRTGGSATHPSATAVSVIDRLAWRAEVMTKVALLAKRSVLVERVARMPDAAVLLWDADGRYEQIS